MSRAFLFAAALAALVPAVVRAQTNPTCLTERRTDTVVGGLIGAGVGAIIGNWASHGGVGATVGGGVGGAAAGAALGGASARCGQNRYGYYDDQGQWVSYRSTDYGYVGPDGGWVARAAPPPTPGDTRARELQMQAELERRLDQGVLARREGRQALRSLSEIAAIDADYRSDDGRLSPAQRQDIEGRLDGLARATGLPQER